MRSWIFWFFVQILGFHQRTDEDFAAPAGFATRGMDGRVRTGQVRGDSRRRPFDRRLTAAALDVVVDLEARKLKKALAIADSLGTRYSLIIGDNELANEVPPPGAGLKTVMDTVPVV